MSLSVCTSCLARLRLSGAAVTSLQSSTRSPTSLSLSLPSSLASSSFHSSAVQQNVVKKKAIATQGARAPKLRESRSARIKKKTRERPKPPPIGQRRQERTRIVLSNTNALELKELENLSVENMADAAKIGQVLALDGPLLDQLREAKVFKTTQNWNLFRAPSTLVRNESVEMGADVERVNRSVQESNPTTIPRLIVGEKASGKSVHLLQAMSMAYTNKWIVINIPDCQQFVMNQSAYAPIPKSSESAEQSYSQPKLASELLSRLAHSNADVLSKLKLVHDHSKALRTKNLKTLKDLALFGAEDSILAPQIWDAMWEELTVKASANQNPRPPIMVAIDGINFWMGETKYRSSNYETIHAHQFFLIKQFLDLLFSKKANSLPNGGIVVACTTKSNHPSFPAFDLLVKQLRSRHQGIALTDSAFPMSDPYSKHADNKVYNLLGGTEWTRLTELHGLSRTESKGLLEYFAKSGVFRRAVDDRTVAEQWSLSGGGIVGEMCKLGARLRTSLLETGPREGVRLRG